MSGWFEDGSSADDTNVDTPEVSVEETKVEDVELPSTDENTDEVVESVDLSPELPQTDEKVEESTDLSSYDLTSDAFTGVFKAKVNGEVREYTPKEVQEAINANYIVSKEQSRLDNERNEWHNRVKAEKDDLIALDKEDPIGAWAKYKGIPEYAVKERLLNLLEEDFYKRAGASSDQELKSIQAQDELEYYRKKDLERENLENEKQQESALNSLKSEHNISESEWDKAYQFLDRMLPPDALLNASSVVNYVLEQRTIESHTENVEILEPSIYNDIVSEYEDNEFFTETDKIELKDFIKQNPGVDFTQIKVELDKYLTAQMEAKLAKKTVVEVEKVPSKDITPQQQALLDKLSGEDSKDSGSWF